MKLLLDENLSFKISAKLADFDPQSKHVKEFGLESKDDESIWNFAKDNDFIIISKDEDFYSRSLVRGHPPKFIYLRIGNCSSNDIIELLRNDFIAVRDFYENKDESMLILGRLGTKT